MSESDIKLRLIRLIVSQRGEVLQELYQIIMNRLYREKTEGESLSALELGYKEMSEDTEREKDAFEWIEGTLNADEL